MSARRLCDRINDFAFGLMEEGAALDANMHTAEPISAVTTRVTWKAAAESAALIYEDSGTINEYLAILKDRNYSFLLNDGGIVQSSYLIDGVSIIKHRLAYYACPFDLIEFSSMVGEFGIVDTIEELLLEDQRTNLRLRSSLRFDYDPMSARDYHPASHMTFASNQGRVPLSSPFTFTSFVKFIFETFYEELWRSGRIFRD